MWSKDLFARSTLVNDNIYLVKNDNVYKLDEVSSLIWDILNPERSLESIVDELYSKFKVDKTILTNDVISFIDSLEKENLIQKN